MRLLALSADGNLTWKEFVHGKAPPYAILSHTWETDEVTFLDLLNHSEKGKDGYRKLIFCGEQAAHDRLDYFWVDTCCIDKRNNTELTKAINSMFRWYRDAARCYVYMSDVSTPALSFSAERYREIWEAEFRQSRWFTRGWTLQELLAPTHVEFYSSRYQRLGTKDSLRSLIASIANIPVSALQGRPLKSFEVKERMTWAAERQTTEEEDGAYCLLGIFDVFMPLIYGEGKENALRRLRKEIDSLPAAGKAPEIGNLELFDCVNWPSYY